MNAQVRIEDSDLNRRLAALAILGGKGLEDAAREVATRFVKAAVRNTPPMIARQSPAQAKREWTARLEANYAKLPYARGRWLGKAEMRRTLQAKKRQLGREAAGWNAAARQLSAKVPAWVKRHRGEGCFVVHRARDRFSITIGNSVPYGQAYLKKRAEFAMGSVKRGLDGALMAIKKKLLRSLK